MGDNGSLTRAQHAVLLWTFLQADCKESPEFCKEVLSLGKDFNDNEATALHGWDYGDLETDGELETDGHISSNLTIARESNARSVPQPAVLQQVAAEIREIADQLQHDIVTRATQNFTRNISRSSTECWKEYLHLEVQNMLAQGVVLDNLQQERVIAALTFTLVKGVCLQAPSLLRSLFDTALQYLSLERGR